MDLQISITRKGPDSYKIITQDDKVITSTILYDRVNTLTYVHKLLHDLGITKDIQPNDQDRNRR